MVLCSVLAVAYSNRLDLDLASAHVVSGGGDGAGNGGRTGRDDEDGGGGGEEGEQGEGRWSVRKRRDGKVATRNSLEHYVGRNPRLHAGPPNTRIHISGSVPACRVRQISQSTRLAA